MCVYILNNVNAITLNWMHACIVKTLETGKKSHYLIDYIKARKLYHTDPTYCFVLHASLIYYVPSLYECHGTTRVLMGKFPLNQVNGKVYRPYIYIYV